MRKAFDVHLELFRGCGWRDFELDPQSTVIVNVVSKAESGLRWLRITSEGNRPFICGNSSRIGNDVSFVIKIIGASLVPSRLPIDDQVIVRKSHTDYRATAEHDAFSHDDLMINQIEIVSRLQPCARQYSLLRKKYCCHISW